MFWDLFTVFFRIGGLTFGGGYAMLPMMQREIVEKKQWATDEEMIDYYAIGQSTPGVIAVNTATFIGYKLKGIGGAIIATIGIVLPSLIIITFIVAFLQQFQEYLIIKHALAGVRVAVTALILDAIIRLWGRSIKDILGLIIFIISFITISFLKVSPIIIIISSALIGIIVKFRRHSKE